MGEATELAARMARIASNGKRPLPAQPAGAVDVPPRHALPQNGNGNGKPGTLGNGRLERRDPNRPIQVSVVIPTLNEAPNLPHVLPRIPVWVHEVVLVDGGSEDGTVDVATALLPGIRVITENRPGKGAALQAGFRAASGDIIVTVDADGSTDPAEMPLFVGCLLAGAEFAKGSRFVQGGGTDDMGHVRRAGNWALRGVVQVAFGGRYSDLCYGYNAFWRRVLPVIEGEADGFEIETLMHVRVLAAGMKVAEVPSHEAPRIYGQSHLNTWKDGYRVLRTIVRERKSLGRRAQRASPRPRPCVESPIAMALARNARGAAEPERLLVARR